MAAEYERTYERIMLLIQAHQPFDTFLAEGEGVPEESVLEAERVLGVSLPPSFRWYLTHYGSGVFHAQELFGLMGDPEDFDEKMASPSIVYHTLLKRKSSGLANHYVCLMSNDGEKFFLDTSRRNSSGENPVVRVDLDDPGCNKIDRAELYAEDFAAFLLRYVEFMIPDL